MFSQVGGAKAVIFALALGLVAAMGLLLLVSAVFEEEAVVFTQELPEAAIGQDFLGASVPNR
ncbi:hypothetical protein H6G62_09525 [Phormidium sp. FACHB-1136]|nr:hypothetical protein [Phormidium sp. FACHB-1136]